MPKIKPHSEIRGVLLYGGRYFFPVSWLHTQAYCEMQLYWEKFKRVEKPPSKKMIQGSRVHKALEKEHLKKAEVKLTIPEAFDLSKREKISIKFREVKVFGKTGLYGRIDEIIISPEEVILLDDKPGNHPWMSNIRQVRGYCLTFDENYSHERITVAQLRNRETGRVFWHEDFSAESRMDTLEMVKRIQSLIKGEREFEPTQNPVKCKSCRFGSICNLKSKSLEK